MTDISKKIKTYRKLTKIVMAGFVIILIAFLTLNYFFFKDNQEVKKYLLIAMIVALLLFVGYFIFMFIHIYLLSKKS